MEKMATQQRGTVPSLRSDLYTHAYRYEFHQAVYLLEMLGRDNSLPVGEGVEAAQEAVRIRARVSLATPGAQVYKLDTQSSGAPPTLHVNFWGLAGIQGPLPLPYTELITQRIKDHDYALRDFLDIFNHRLISLLHRVRKKTLPCLNTQAPENAPQSMSLRALFGLRDYDAREVLGLDPKILLGFSSLFWQQPRSAVGLKIALEAFLKTHVAIHLLEGGWVYLESDQSTLVGGPRGRFNRLGDTATLGTKVWRTDQGILIVLGPMKRTLFDQCIKSGSLYPTLMRLIRAYLPGNLEFRVQLRLESADLSTTGLGRQAQLGATAWLLERAVPGDVDEQVVLYPEKSIFTRDIGAQARD